jgi:5-methylcytosine-specific restriction endonuclease McrA
VKKYTHTETWRINKRKNQSKRRAIKKTFADDTITQTSLLKLIKIQKNQCIYCWCNIKENYHIDHIIPISKKWIHSIFNIQLLCPKCNMIKNNKLVFWVSW